MRLWNTMMAVLAEMEHMPSWYCPLGSTNRQSYYTRFAKGKERFVFPFFFCFCLQKFFRRIPWNTQNSSRIQWQKIRNVHAETKRKLEQDKKNIYRIKGNTNRRIKICGMKNTKNLAAGQCQIKRQKRGITRKIKFLDTGRKKKKKRKVVSQTQKNRGNYIRIHKRVKKKRDKVHFEMVYTVRTCKYVHHYST